MIIKINCEDVETDLPEISYEQIISLAGLNENPNIVYSMIYSMGRNDISGCLTRGKSVVTKQGMSIQAMRTDNA